MLMLKIHWVKFVALFLVISLGICLHADIMRQARQNQAADIAASKESKTQLQTLVDKLQLQALKDSAYIAWLELRQKFVSQKTQDLADEIIRLQKLIENLYKRIDYYRELLAERKIILP